jgi:hypothetical protein
MPDRRARESHRQNALGARVAASCDVDGRARGESTRLMRAGMGRVPLSMR